MSESDKKVYKINDQDKVKQHIGQKVNLKGSTKGDAIEVEEIATAEGK